MSFSNVQIDTYVSDMSEPTIDTLSKIYIIANWFIGINILTVAFKVKGLWMIVAFMFSILFNIIIVYSLVILSIHNSYTSVYGVAVTTQYLICSFVAIISRETLQKFYNELCEFDKDVKINFPINYKTKVNLVLAILLLFAFMAGMLVDLLQNITSMVIVLTFMYVNSIIELFYYGHLFILLETRLKSIRVLLVSCFPHENRLHSVTESEDINFDDQFIRKLISNNSGIEIKKLSLLYYNIIKAYDFLNAAIKWQVT